MAERGAREIAKHRLVVRRLHGESMLRASPFGILALVTLRATSRSTNWLGCNGAVKTINTRLVRRAPAKQKRRRSGTGARSPAEQSAIAIGRRPADMVASVAKFVTTLQV